MPPIKKNIGNRIAEGTTELYKQIAAGLRGPHLLAFGFCCLAMLTFVGLAFGAQDHYSLVIYVVVASLCALVCLVTVFVVKPNVPPKKSDPPALSPPIPASPQVLEPYLKAIEEAIGNVSTLARTRLIKEDLFFKITFLRFANQEETAGIAKLAGSYKVRNFGEATVNFPFFAQVDVSENMVGAVDGDFRVRNVNTGDEPRNNQISFTSERSKNGLSHIFKDKNPVAIPSGATMEFKWSTSEFEIRLPYCEFFTTAQPVFNIKIELVNKFPIKHYVKAEAFRSAEADSVDPREVDDAVLIDVGGVFLPYQGILVRVYPENE